MVVIVADLIDFAEACQVNIDELMCDCIEQFNMKWVCLGRSVVMGIADKSEV